MALFGKLFEKKVCSICGGEIGLLGNRKLADGNCCKKCASKLSRWFEDRRESTVAQIMDQIAYREKNAEELKLFVVSDVIGEYEKMYIETVDDVPARFFVASDRNYLDENPDIISFADVISCTLDIDENEEELMRENEKGESVSYNPQRFEHHYNFYIDMVIRNNPYFDSIRFNINDDDVTLETVRGRNPVSPVSRNPAYSRPMERYKQYEQMGKEICQAVEAARNGAKAQKEAVVAAEAAKPAFCPACGAPSGDSNFCQFCGSKLV